MADYTLHPILDRGDHPAPTLWYALHQDGSQPAPRLGHSLAQHGSSLIMFGGASNDGPFNDVHFFDLERLKWTRIASKQAPSARYEHAAFKHPARNELVVMFGATTSNNMNDIHIFDINARTWKSVATTGVAPSPRTCHHVAIVGSRAFVICGGATGADPVPDTQLHVLDLDTYAWTQPATTGPPMTPRLGHSLCSVGTTLVLYGGMRGAECLGDLWLLDTECMEWRCVGNHMLLFGGMSLTATGPVLHDTLHCLHATSWSWSAVKIGTSPIPARLGHCMLAVQWTPRPATPDSDLQAASASQSGSASTPRARPDATVAQIIDITDKFGLGQAIEDDDDESSEVLGESAPKTVTPPAAPIAPQSGPVHALLVSGGIDLQGNIFDDLLVFVPEQ